MINAPVQKAWGCEPRISAILDEHASPYVRAQCSSTTATASTSASRQLGHANLGITSIYLQGIDSSEIISTVHGRPSPTISANAGLQMKR